MSFGLVSARRPLWVGALLLIALVPAPAAASNPDCSTVTIWPGSPWWSGSSGSVTWDPAWGSPPTTYVHATTQYKCVISGFGIPAGVAVCPGVQPCLKTWLYLREDAADGASYTQKSCGTGFATSISGSGQLALTPRITPLSDGVLCEYYCPRGPVCALGATVALYQHAFVGYEPAHDPNAVPGSASSKGFHAQDSAGTYYYTQQTCQAGAPHLALLCPLI